MASAIGFIVSVQKKWLFAKLIDRKEWNYTQIFNVKFRSKFELIFVLCLATAKR